MIKALAVDLTAVHQSVIALHLAVVGLNDLLAEVHSSATGQLLL